MVNNINAKELVEKLKNRDSIEIIDVREKEEYDIIHVKNSKLIPMEEIQNRVNEIDWSKEVIFICRSGARSGMVANFLFDQDKKISNLKGGIFACHMQGDCDLEVLENEVERYF